MEEQEVLAPRYIDRALSKRLLSLVKQFPCVVLVGARQVGKSTLLQHLFKGFQYVVFDPVIDVENARADPELFLNNRAPPLILDEIQYAPEILAPLKRRIDKEQKPGQYILTGSQQWGVIKNIAESLAGRAVFLDLEGFCLSEVAETEPRWLERWLKSPDEFIAKPSQRLKLPYALYEHIWRGGFPKAQFLSLENIGDFHAAYHSAYIGQDVRLLANISDLQLFGRFVRLVAALSAQEINFSELGRDLGIHPATAKGWLGLLKEAFQWFEYPAYTGNVLKRISLKPKGYCSDTGQVCFAQAISTPHALGGHPLWGALFETAVVNEIRKQASFLSSSPNIYHWRSHGGAECDLLLERDGILYPIEIKATSRPSRGDTSGLRAFRETYPSLRIAPGLVIAPTERFQQLSEKDYAMPWDSN
jgi:uncharacterized protein